MLHTNDQIIKHKVGLLNLAEELGNVYKACQVMGLSRDKFYRYKQAVEEGGVDALLNKSRRKANPKNRVDEAVRYERNRQSTLQDCHSYDGRLALDRRPHARPVSPWVSPLLVLFLLSRLVHKPVLIVLPHLA
jgi:hypothetical protein